MGKCSSSLLHTNMMVHGNVYVVSTSLEFCKNKYYVHIGPSSFLKGLNDTATAYACSRTAQKTL